MTEDGITISRRTLRRIGMVLAVLLLGAGCGSGKQRLTVRSFPSTTLVTVQSTTTSATTAPPTTAAPTTAPATVTTVTVESFVAFSQPWGRHGFGMSITATGHGTADWRTYNWCTSSPPPCDSMQGNNIVSGGHATFGLATASGGIAHGTISYSTDPSTMPLGPVTLDLAAGDELIVSPGSAPQITLCGPQAVASCYGA